MGIYPKANKKINEILALFFFHKHFIISCITQTFNIVFRSIYINPVTNDTYQEGENVKLLKLAETLKIIAEEGGDALHKGSLTENFVKDVQDNDGILTVEDMNNYL